MRRAAAAVLVSIGVLLLASVAVYAERAWVGGDVRLNLRTGPGTGYRILVGVTTGDSLEVLERGEDWTRVRSTEGKEGWIPAGYLVTEPPPTVRLAAAEEEAARLREQLARIGEEAEKLRGRNEEISSTDEQQRAELDRLTRENYELRAGARYPEWITGALILSSGMAVGAILSRLSTRNKRQRIRL